MTGTGPVVILGCGAAKRSMAPDERVPAVELYTGPLYLARLAYARTRAPDAPHFILSAKHGLIRPDERIGTYEVDLRKEKKADRDRWAARVQSMFLSRVPSGTHVVVLASGPYAAWARALVNPYELRFRDREYTVEFPGDGLPLGKALSFFRRLAAAEDCLAGLAAQPDPEPHYEAQAAEVERDLPGWQDEEECEMPVGTLRVLLHHARGGGPLEAGAALPASVSREGTR